MNKSLFFLLLATAAFALTPWWLWSLPGWLLLSNLLHELGHLLSYKLVGLPLLRLQWGPVVYTPGRLTLDSSGKPWAAGCSCKRVPLPYWKYAVALLSGGVLTLLTGVLFLLLKVWSIGIAMTLNGAAALLNPRSADRRILKSLR